MLRIFRGLLLGVLLACAARAADPEKSVIQITTFSQQPAWDAPWRFEGVRRASGSGFVVRGKRIMTNAHVVSWAQQLIVHRYQDPHPYLARVAFVGHDCDLALLEVEDEKFFDGLEPLEFGDLPKVRSAVVTYGYPAGGEQISYTRGVVSRIEMQTYVHIGNRAFLTAQTDAAINPGNSGGPVIQDDRVVGVSFQGMSGLENTGFFIPPPTIQHFLKDVSDGTYDGFPQAGLRLAPLQNPTYRRYLKLPDNDLGARVDRIAPDSPSENLVKEEDVLLQVGPYPVGSDGTILYQGNRVQSAAAFSEVQNGESIPLRLWRQGKELDLSVPLKVRQEDLAEGNQYILPKYYIYGGLVFTPLSRDYLKSFGPNWSDSANAELIYELYYHHEENPKTWRREPVVLSMVLANPANANLTVRGRALVDKINGVRVECLNDAVRAFENSTNGQDIIEFVSQHTFECLDRDQARKSMPDILQTYSIAQDRRL